MSGIDNNPISFEDLFNFNDLSTIEKGINGINTLKKTYTEFFNSVVGGQLERLSLQEKDLQAQNKALTETTKTLTVVNKAHQKALLDNLNTAQKLKEAQDALKKSREDAKKTDDAARGSVNALTKEYKDLRNAYAAAVNSGDTQKMADIGVKARAVDAQIKQMNEALKATKTVFTAAAGSYAALDAENKKLIADLKQLPNGLAAGNKEAAALEKQIFANTARLKDFDASINQNFRNVGNYKSALANLGNQFSSFAVGYLSIQAAFGLVSHVIDVNKQIADSMADVRRTADLTEVEVNALVETLKKIDTRTSLQGLLQIAVIGGQLGIAKKDLAGFTQAVDQLAVTLAGEIPGGAEVVATALGKINGVFKTQQKEGTDAGTALNKTGSAILKLGQAGLATGGFLQDFTQRVAGAADVAKISLPTILAYGAVLEETGSSAEVAGTAFNRLVGALAQKREQFFSIAKIADSTLTLKQFTDLINNDANKALQLFFQGLNKGGTNLTSFNDLIKDLGLRAGPARNAIIELAKNQELLNTRIGQSVEAYDKGTLSAEQFKLKNDNLAGSVEKLKNEFDNAVQGDGIGKFFKSIVDGARYALDGLDKLFKSRSPQELIARLFTPDASSFDTANNINDTIADVNKKKANLQSKGGFQNMSTNQLKELIPQYQQAALEARRAFLQYANGVQKGTIKDVDGGLYDIKNTAIELNDTYKQLTAAYVEARDKQAAGVKGQIADIKQLTDAELTSIPQIKARIKELTALPDSGILGSATNLRIVALDNRLKALRGTTKAVKDGFAELQAQIDLLEKKLQDKVLSGASVTENDPLVKRIQALIAKLNIAKQKYDDLLRGPANFPLPKPTDSEAQAIFAAPQPGLEKAQRKIDLTNQADDAAHGLDTVAVKFAQQNRDLVQLYQKGLLTKEQFDAQLLQSTIDEQGQEYYYNKVLLDKRLKLQQIGSKEYLSILKQIADLDRRYSEQQIENAQRVEAARVKGIHDIFDVFNKQAEPLAKVLGKGYGDVFKTLSKTTEQWAIDQKLTLTDAFETASGLANGFTQAYIDGSNARITQLGLERDHELTLAGNNADAKKAIEDRYNKAVAQEKTKQAKADKLNAMFQIAIATAVAVVKALPNIPLSIAIGVLGAAELALVASKAIPKFYKGRRGGPEQIGIVNDRGPEAMESNGKIWIPNGGKETAALIPAGANIYTADETERMFQDKNNSSQFLDSLLNGTQIVRAHSDQFNERLLHTVANNVLKPETMERAFAKALDGRPVHETHIDEQGFHDYETRKNMRIEKQSQRRKAGGKG